MNKKIVVAAAAAIIVVGGGLYWAFDSMTGNKVEIESVLSTQNAGSENETKEAEGSVDANNESEGTDQAQADASLDGTWNIDESSNVYFSVTTSRETVNYELSDVTGTWNIDSNDLSLTTAEASIALASMDSGNSQRDSHVTSADYLDVAQFPNATFTLTSFDGLSSEWVNGDIVDVSFKGDLTVKGITKEVEFTGKGQYDNGSLKLEANTVVTFGDFGMESPHAIVMDTENDLAVQLQLVLNK